MQKRNNVGIYCRLSDEDKNKDGLIDSQSIKNQKSLLMDYAVSNNWNIYSIYSDDDYSGADRSRPEWLRLINDCKSGNINIVLCKSLSRFSREVEIIEKYINRLFVEWGIRFVGLADYADTERLGNRRSIQINSLTNEWYLEDCSNNIRKVLHYKASKGEFLASFAPYGYLKDPNNKHHLIVDKTAAETVRRIFQLYIEGYGVIKIAKLFNEEKLPPPSVYKKICGLNYYNLILDYSEKRQLWTASTLTRILSNEVYIGNTVQGKQTNVSFKSHKKIAVPKEKWIRVLNTHEPIIDLDTWNIAQSIRASKQRRGKTTGSPSPLNRKIYCARCKATLKREHSTSNGVKYKYLQCATRRISNNCDNEIFIKLADVEQAVLDEINKLLSKYYDKEKIIIDKQTNSYTISLKNQINQLKLQIEKNNDKVFKLYQDKINNIITENQFKDFNSRISMENATLEDKLLKIKESYNQMNPQNDNNKNIDVLLEKYKHIEELNPFIVEYFIDKIFIDKISNNQINIDIQWKI